MYFSQLKRRKGTSEADFRKYNEEVYHLLATTIK